MLKEFGILLKSILKKRLKMNNKERFLYYIPRYEQEFVIEVSLQLDNFQSATISNAHKKYEVKIMKKKFLGETIRFFE